MFGRTGSPTRPPRPPPPVQRSASAPPEEGEGNEGNFPPSPGAKGAPPPRKSPFGTTGTRRLARPPQSPGRGRGVGCWARWGASSGERRRACNARGLAGHPRPAPSNPLQAALQWEVGLEKLQLKVREMEGEGGQGPSWPNERRRNAIQWLLAPQGRQAGRQVAELPLAC